MNQQPEDSPQEKLFPSLEKYDFKIPQWFGSEHPKFPGYFYVVALDEKGEPISWWQRLPEHMRLPPPL